MPIDLQQAKKRAQNIQLVIFDVDGVLTNGRLYLNEQGEAHKQFHSLDGFGIQLLHRIGMQTAIITGRKSDIVAQRAQELQIQHVFQGVSEKYPVFLQLIEQLHLDKNACAYMGDDWPDLPILNHCGLATAPSNAHPEVKKQAHWISTQPGGLGAVRELCDFILEANSRYASLLKHAQGATSL